MNLIELKAVAYDLLLQIQNLQQKLFEVNRAIVKFKGEDSIQTEPVKGKVVAKMKKMRKIEKSINKK